MTRRVCSGLMNASFISIATLFFTGLLAGEELIVRVGVRDVLWTLAPRPQLELRQALIRRMRIAVPLVFIPALLLNVAVAALGPRDALRIAAAAAMGVFAVATFGGTVPINQRVGSWSAGAPPTGWESELRRWEKLETLRCVLVLSAFALLLARLHG